MPKITILTTKANALKEAIFEAVEDDTLKTWETRSSTDKAALLTHNPTQWADRALLEFIVKKDSLVIIAKKWKEHEDDIAAKAYFIGRFTEMLLVHFSDHFDEFTVSK